MSSRTTRKFRWLCAAALMVFASGGVWALANADLKGTPGGADPTPATKFSDANGKLDYRRGADATWAEAWGKITDNDVTKTSAAAARITDNKEWAGAITNVDDGYWKLKADAVMFVAVTTHGEINYNGPLHATARGVLCAWGDLSGCEALEISSELGARRHDYDITETVNGLNVTISDGGRKYPAGSPLQTIDKYDTVTFTTGPLPVLVPNLITKFTYESRAAVDMKVTLTGSKRNFAEAESKHGAPFAREWKGEAEAWEKIPAPGKDKLIKKFVLD